MLLSDLDFMKLPLPFLKSKKESKAYYLSLILNNERITAIILEESSGIVKILSQENQLISDNIENLPLEELIKAIDQVISKTEELIPADVELNKTVFGVKENWVEEDSKKIKKDYLKNLKKICDSLDLTPIGFMVLSEAITNFLQQEEGAPISAIYVEIGSRLITLSLFRGGRLVQKIEGGKGSSIAHAVDELMKQFTAEVLPARLALHDPDGNNELYSQFVGHQWSKSLPFLHIPQINILSSDFECKAVAYGVSNQMGLEFESNGQALLKTLTADVKTSDEVQDEVVLSKAEPEIEMAQIEDEPKITGSENENQFGFVFNKDVSEMDEVRDSDNIVLNNNRPYLKVDEGDNFKPVSSDLTIQDDIKENIREDEMFESEKQESGGRKIKMPKFSMPAFSYKWALIVLVPILILGVIVGGAYYYFTNNMSAVVMITLTPKEKVKTVDVVFTTEEGNDFDNNILSAKQVEDSVEGDLEAKATGKKEVGEKAKGTVTVYNNDTDSEIDVSKGTTIESSNGLEFTIDEDVSISSASGDIFSGTKPGTSKVKVIAAEIGTKYNLPSGTKFSVSDNSSLAAKNDDAFSGGTSKSITVISEDDITKLNKSLTAKLEEKATQVLGAKTQRGEVIIPVILSSALDEAKSNKEAGDEASSISLAGTLNFSSLAYSESDLKDFAKKIIEKDTADDLKIDESSINIKIKDAEREDGGDVAAKAVIEGALLPKLEESRIKEQLSGKSTIEANDILSKLPYVEKTTIEYSPNIPYIGNLIPRLPNNVEVSISSKK